MEALGALVERLRALPSLVERKPGIFYRKGQAFLHFHEDLAGLFADIWDGGTWVRLALSDQVSHEQCLATALKLLER